jgi:flagellar L-ring protein precursor FlgH
MKTKFALSTAFALALLLAGAAFAAPTLYGGYNLYTDKKGKRAGDVVTVLVTESAKASNDTRTETAKSADVSVSAALGKDFAAGLSGGAANNYGGKGATARNGQLTATVTARIAQVLDNGNLLIEGSKVVTINNEEEILEVSGTIRADDINPDNTVYSYKIADAVIRYTGSGVNADAEKPGLITRFFNWIF